MGVKRWLLKGNHIVLPKSLRKAVLELAHDPPMSGHLGLGKYKKRVLQSFYWPGVFADVTRRCRIVIYVRGNKCQNILISLLSST
jgi:hypothetical protein